MTALSVLDLSFVPQGASGPDALANTIGLARHADDLGFTRFWVAEHHNLPSIASGAPEVMIAAIAAATSRMRVGAGGVMLPNHAPLLVAERFKVLEALYPGRIDLGLGRAPGTDQLTALAVRRRTDGDPAEDFLERLRELFAWESGFPAGHPFAPIRVMPTDVALPPVFLLGSSGYSARLAAEIGAAFAFAHHFASHDAADAMLTYRQNFRPGWIDQPYSILTVAAIAAETDEEAERLAASADLMHLRRARGEFSPIPSLAEARAYPYTPMDRARILHDRARLFVGGADGLAERLSAFAGEMQADELMITTVVHDQEARRNSYALLADRLIGKT